jgi:hypothetical protein
LCRLFSDAANYGEKRRKPTQLSALTYLLDDSDIIDDLKIINKNKAFSVSGIRILARVAIFKPKIPILGKLWRALEWKMLVYFTTI